MKGRRSDSEARDLYARELRRFLRNARLDVLQSMSAEIFPELDAPAAWGRIQTLAILANRLPIARWIELISRQNGVLGSFRSDEVATLAFGTGGRIGLLHQMSF